MQLITTYAGGAYYSNTALSIKAFDTWVQKGSLTKIGKPNEIT